MSTKKRGTDTEISDEKSGIGMKEEEQLLAEALKRYDDELIDEFFNEEDDEKPVPLTEHGRQGMKHLLEQWVGPEDAQKILQQEQETYETDLVRWKKKRQARLCRRIRRWGTVAAAAAFTLIISAVNVQDSLAFKLPTAGFKAAVKDDYTQLLLETEDLEKGQEIESTSINTNYCLGNVLDGYSLSDCIVLSDSIIYIYENGDKSYSFIQQVEATQVFTNTELKEGEFIHTMYGMAFFSQSEDSSSLVWNYQGYTFRLDGNLSKDDLLGLLESLQKENDEIQ